MKKIAFLSLFGVATLAHPAGLVSFFPLENVEA
jgi:hypothetical protein